MTVSKDGCRPRHAEMRDAFVALLAVDFGTTAVDVIAN